MRTHALLVARWLIAVAWSVGGCNLVAPLEDVRVTRRDAGSKQAPRSAERSSTPPSDSQRSDASTKTATDAAAMPDAVVEEEDAGPAPIPCKLTTLTPCNPVQQCGCKPDERCALDDNGTTIRCVAGSIGDKRKGEPCKLTSECAAGLECAYTELCSPYCAKDSECNSDERCIQFFNEESGMLVTGSGACEMICDPVSREPCPDNTRCASSFEDFPIPWASCISTVDHRLYARGESCQAIEARCESGLGCARFGPEICVSLCRSDADCPDDAPRCHFEDRLAAPGEPIGECMQQSCDDVSIPAPAWTQGPVATATELMQCEAMCLRPASDNPYCVRERCVDGLADCFAESVAACAALPNGPCRAEYVAASCANWEQRFEKMDDYHECVAKQPACAMQAQTTCVHPAP